MRTIRMMGVGIAIWLGMSSAMALGQAPPPPPASPTLWSFLGIPQASYKIHAQLFNRRGNHPNVEKKPPLKGIADPANLKSDVPAIKAAAEVKQAEDLKPQKIKAIKYLATIGCGCYDKDEKITKALLAAMDDCTEEVRLAAVNAVRDAALSGACENCSRRSCCNEKITNQLYKIAYEMDDLGCPLEPSERVREAAVEALGVCCPHRLPVESVAPEAPVEGGDRPAPVEGGEATPTPAAPNTPAPAAAPAVQDPAPAPPANQNRAAKVDPNHFLRDASLRARQATQQPSSRRTSQLQPISQVESNSIISPMGVVTLYDTRRQVAHVHFPNSKFVPEVGSKLQVWVPTTTGRELAGELEVVQSEEGSADVKVSPELDLLRIGREARIVP